MQVKLLKSSVLFIKPILKTFCVLSNSVPSEQALHTSTLPPGSVKRFRTAVKMAHREQLGVKKYDINFIHSETMPSWILLLINMFLGFAIELQMPSVCSIIFAQLLYSI